MNSTKFKGREKLKKCFKGSSNSPVGGSSSTSNPSAAPPPSNLRPNAPHLQLNPPVQVKATSSSLNSKASLNTTAVETSASLSTSQSLPPLLSSRPSVSSDPTQSFVSISPSAITIPTTVTLTEGSELSTEESPFTEDTPINIWKEVFDKVNDETKKWIRDNGLGFTELSKPGGEIKELITLLKSKKALSEKIHTPTEIKIGSHKIVFRNYIDGVIRFLMMAGDIALTPVPPQPTAPWAAAKVLLTMPLMQIEEMAALAGTVQWFIRIIRRGQVYELIYNATTADDLVVSNLRDSLRDLYIAALELLARSQVRLESGLAKQTLKALTKPPRQATGLNLDLLEKEQKAIADAQACENSRSARADKNSDEQIKAVLTQLESMSMTLTRIDEGVTRVDKGVVRIDEGVATLLEASKRKDLEELMNFISSETFGKGHATMRQQRTEGTGDWLIEHDSFNRWYAKSTSALLCLEGTVGTGKTFLTYRVIEHIKNILKASAPDEGFAYFYCTRSGDKMQDPLVVLRSFVRQLFLNVRDDDYQKKVICLCEEAKKDREPLGLDDCKELILDSLNFYPRTTIILDALDESEVKLHNLAKILTGFMKKATNPVKIFISSRPGRKYLEEFKTGLTITVDRASQQSDIEKFLLEKVYHEEFYHMRSKKIQKLIKETLESRHDGMFQWVHLQVERLLPCTADDAVRLWAKDIPLDLKGTYDQLWDEIQTKHNNCDIALAERAIKWVICSIQPLKSEILLEAIRYDFNGDILVRKDRRSEQQILSLCKDFLTIDAEKQVWMVSHASVEDYFVSKGWTSGKCHLFAAWTSLNFLIQFDGKLPQDTNQDTDEDTDEDVDENAFQDAYEEAGFAHHAGYAWCKHVEHYDRWLGSEKDIQPDAKLVALLKKFLGSPRQGSRQFEEWFEKLDSPWTDHQELAPSSTTCMPLFLMCRHGFYYVLSDWWEEGQIAEQMALGEYWYWDNTLALAAKGRSVPICRHLVEMINRRSPRANCHGQALRDAIWAGDKEIISILVEDGKADINDQDCTNQFWSIQEYSMRKPELFRWLVKRGYINMKREGGKYGNVLNTAAARRMIRSVKILLKAGADVNAAVKCGEYGSALAAAVLGSGEDDVAEIIRMLVENGADVNLPLKVGHFGSVLEALLWKAGKTHDEPHMTQYELSLNVLLKAGADPAMMLDRGRHGSALAVAACFGLKDMLAKMIGVTGTDQAIGCLRKSKRPKGLILKNEEEWRQRTTETVEYLTDEIRVDKETLHKIGLWQVSPEEVGVFKNGNFVYF